jgi:mRNA deadenylase 3'-5' endonuclease subunit Ccr4
MDEQKIKTAIRISTFNLLAPCTIDSVQCENRDHLNWLHRWPLLQEELERLTNSQDILVLQEVDTQIELSGLYQFLVSRNYVYIRAFMSGPRQHGVAIAFPAQKYEAQEIGYERLGLCVRTPLNSNRDIKAPRLFPACKTDYKAFSEAKFRNYLMPWARVRDRETGLQFGVFGEHMPCAHQRPKVMAVRLEALMRRAYELCSGFSFFVAGDFNFTPGSSLHQFATTGLCPFDVRPSPGFGKPAKHLCRLDDPLASLLPPDSVTNRTPTFQGKIDYVFTSTDSKIKLVDFKLQSPARPIPNEESGSDHVPLTCVFELSN